MKCHFFSLKSALLSEYYSHFCVATKMFRTSFAQKPVQNCGNNKLLSPK